MGSHRRDESRIKGMTAAVKGAEDGFHCTRGDRQKARAETVLRAVRGLLLLEAAARHEIGKAEDQRYRRGYRDGQQGKTFRSASQDRAGYYPASMIFMPPASEMLKPAITTPFWLRMTTMLSPRPESILRHLRCRHSRASAASGGAPHRGRLSMEGLKLRRPRTLNSPSGAHRSVQADVRLSQQQPAGRNHGGGAQVAGRNEATREEITP